MRAAPERTRLTSESACVTPSGKIKTRPPSPKRLAKPPSVALFLALEASLSAESCGRSMGTTPEARNMCERTGSLNSVCFATVVNSPGKVATISIGSINPLGCHVMKRTPPSGGRFSSSTMLISLNQIFVRNLKNLRMIRYESGRRPAPSRAGSRSQRMGGGSFPSI